MLGPNDSCFIYDCQNFFSVFQFFSECLLLCRPLTLMFVNSEQPAV